MKILIIKPSSLGDVIHCMPVVHDLKEADPSLEIHWLVNNSFRELVSAVNGVDKVITFDRNLWKEKKVFFKNIKSLFNLVKNLQNEKYDIALDFQGLFRSAFLTYLSNSKRKIGFKDTREPCSFFYNEKVDVLYNNLHAIDKNRKIIQKLYPSNEISSAQFEIQIPDSIKSSVDNLLKYLKVEGKFCVLCPEARWESKKWPEEYYLKLAELIIDRFNIQVVITGDKSSQDKWDKLTEKFNPRIVSATGKTSLLELAEILSRCDFSVTNDSGPMHLSVAMDKKVYALLGPTAPNKTGPYKNAKIIKSELDCCPCFKKECPKGTKNSPCMAIIKPENVMKQFDENY